MKVFTFFSSDPELPEHQRAIARFKVDVPLFKGGGVRQDWHPVIIHGATEIEAAEKAETWWTDMVAKEKAKAENIANGIAKRAAKKGDA